MPRLSILALTALFSVLPLACLGSSSSVPDSLSHTLSPTHSNRASLSTSSTSYTTNSTFITISTATTSSTTSTLSTTTSSTLPPTTLIEVAIPTSSLHPSLSTDSGYFTNSAGDVLADWYTELPTSTLEAAQWTASLSLAEGITAIATITGTATAVKQAVATTMSSVSSAAVVSDIDQTGGSSMSSSAAPRTGDERIGLMAAILAGAVGAIALGM